MKHKRNTQANSPSSPFSSTKTETIVLHEGFRYDPTTFVTTVPIYHSNAFAFPTIDYASDVFDLRQMGHTYTRLMNPTCDVLEERIAALEGGCAALLTASGQAAIALAILNIAIAGDNIVSSNQLYGGTWNLLATTFERMGIETRFVDPTDPENFRAATDIRTRCYFGEALPNPMLKPFPIRDVGTIAHEIGVPLIIDNTLTPYVSRPFELGADIIVHSVSKYICGHSTAIGGIVVDKGSFDWKRHANRFAIMTKPDKAHGGILWREAVKNLDGAYGKSPYILKMRNTLMRDLGACASPFNAFLFLQGLETLPLRMPQHCKNALIVAEMLAYHQNVLNVTYPMLGDAVMKQRAQDNMGVYGGPLLQFEIAGGIEAGKRFIEQLKMIYHVSNIGDSRTLATHPASTTHASVSKKARIASGVLDGTIRISVGLEHIDDILGDLQQALEGV